MDNKEYFDKIVSLYKHYQKTKDLDAIEAIQVIVDRVGSKFVLVIKQEDGKGDFKVTFKPKGMESGPKGDTRRPSGLIIPKGVAAK
jgi:hypothetical protein